VAAPAPRGSPVRLGLFYATLYVSTGASAPYLAVWLKAGGLSGGQIGTVLALPLLARVATGPALAVWADGFKLRRTAIALMAAAAAVLFAALLTVQGFWPWLGLWLVGATLLGACSPLVDVIVLKRAARDEFDFGFARGIGSMAYVAANVGCGVLLTWLGPRLVVVWIALAALASTLLTKVLLPADPVRDPDTPSPRPDRFGGLGALVRNRAFMLMIVSVGLIQAAHGFYYSFSTLVWRSQGLSSGVIGLLWGVGVATEVAFLWFGEPLRRRLGPERLLIFGGAGAVARWTAFAFSPPVWLLFPLQTLHALSFTATFIASLQLVERMSPPGSASAAQSLNAALYSGVLIGLSTIASGPLYDHFGALGYLAMSGLAAVGLLGALRLKTLKLTRL
jgi:PPP family 3-phenylpropionic acid transporter